MLGQAERLVQALPPVPAGRSPWKAYVIGFLFSGLGLGLYLRSWVDLVVPTAVWLLLIALPGVTGFWLGAFLGGTWGLLRVSNS
jgi:hypothetical protein